jgi:hypothetical protein
VSTRVIASSRASQQEHAVETGLAIVFVIAFGFLTLITLAATGWLVPRDPSSD